MRAVLAIARAALRSALRSRVILALLGLLLLAIIGLPLTIKGDGTSEGFVRILISYTLGAVTLLLSTATIWSGCAAISTEITEKRIHLILTKPVSRTQVWLGHWLGLLILNGSLLMVAGLTIYGLLQWNLRTLPDADNLRTTIMASLRPVQARAFDTDTPARELLQAREAAGDLPEGMNREQALDTLRAEVIRRAWAVGPGLQRIWLFNLPGVPAETETIQLRFKFSSSSTERAPVRGLWLAGTPDEPELFRQIRDWHPGLHTLEVPASVLKGQHQLRIAFANINPTPVTVFFDPNEGQALVPEGAFEGNFVRALLATFLGLAFLSALSARARAVFSLPVAPPFCSYTVLLLYAGDYIRTMAGQRSYFGNAGNPAPVAAFIDSLFRAFFTFMRATVTPLQGPDILDLLATGRLVSWSLLGAIFLYRVLIGGGLCALVGIYIFNRREIGKPV